MIRFPQSRGEALCAYANNASAIDAEVACAAAAWKHLDYPVRFSWSRRFTPLEAMLHTRDAPSILTHQWCIIFRDEVIAKSALFSSLSASILQRIVECATRGPDVCVSQKVQPSAQ